MQVKCNVLDRQFQMYQEEYEQAALRVLRSGWYVLGNEVRQFEEEFAQFTGRKYCVGLNSGLDALIMSVRRLASVRVTRLSYRRTRISRQCLVSRKTARFLCLWSRTNILTWMRTR